MCLENAHGAWRMQRNVLQESKLNADVDRSRCGLAMILLMAMLMTADHDD